MDTPTPWAEPVGATYGPRLVHYGRLRDASRLPLDAIRWLVGPLARCEGRHLGLAEYESEQNGVHFLAPLGSQRLRQL
jgi:hypothetical protein